MKNFKDRIVDELQQVVGNVKNSECEIFSQLLTKDVRIFLAGLGRSGLVVRGFAMRLMHMGYTVHCVGDATTPSITSNDILLIASGSGNTPSLIEMAKKAKELKAKIMLLTIDTHSVIGELADAIIEIPAPSPKVVRAVEFHSEQPMGSLAEQTMGIILDSLILSLMDRDNISSKQMFVNHANLE